MKSIDVLKAFLSSPDDVKKERRITEDLVNTINKKIKYLIELDLDLVMWENLLPTATKIPDEKMQDILNKELKDCQIFIIILYKRYGSIENGYLKSNTEREIDIILELKRDYPEKTILSYFRELPKDDDPGNQEIKIRELRERLSKEGIIYRKYLNSRDFKEILTYDIYDILLRIRLSPRKVVALKNFWKLDMPSKEIHPKLGIICPYVEKQYSPPKMKGKYWLIRLKPNLYFEDFKAVQKVIKTLRLIGFRSYQSYISDAIPPLEFMNRVWVCTRRLKISEDPIIKYKNDLRFQFLKKRGSRYAELIWKSTDGQEIIIKSPLHNYLKIQRKKMDISKDWHSQLGKIYAKDYAILARLSDLKSKGFESNGYLKDFFITGIRGLGTWGAAWYIDRKSSNFLKYENHENIQIVLEVTYREDKIINAEDVSEMSQEYFNEQNSLKVIKNNIKRYSVNSR